MKWVALACGVIVALSLVLVIPKGIPSHQADNPSVSELGYAAHDPIYISGNAGFNSTNGVVRGDGTQNNPYVITGWEINASTTNLAGISVMGTDAYFVITDVWIHSGENHAEGIDLWSCSDAVLSGNLIEGNWGGIVASECANITVVDNTLIQSDYGVWIEFSEEVEITHNKVMSSNETGISLSHCENASAYWNYVSGCDIGMSVGGGHSVNITWNNVTGNNQGICASNDMAAGPPVLIYNNNLWGNTEQANYSAQFIVWPCGRVAWNATYPVGGNFWSDYEGLDLYSGPDQDESGADGIGDTEYSINMSWWGEPGYHIPDNYPLMAPIPMNWAPMAAFVVDPVAGNTLTIFRVNASSSSDLEDPPSELSFRWDFEGDGTWDVNWTTENTSQWQYSLPGIYTVRLEVRDTQGLTNSTSLQVEVLGEIPEFPAAVVPVLPLLLIIAVISWSRQRRNKL